MKRVWTIVAATLTLTAAGCGSEAPDYDVTSSTPDRLTVSVPSGISDDEIVSVLNDLHSTAEYVDGDYRISFVCPDGLEAGVGFLRNSDGEREARRLADC